MPHTPRRQIIQCAASGACSSRACAAASVAATCIIVIACCVLAADGEPSQRAAAAESTQADGSLPTASASAAPKLLREGTLLVDAHGRFIANGERTIFRPNDSTAEFRVLENLSLERVNTELGFANEGSQWKVSGLVTEYRGANYLIIHRAIMQTNQRRPAARLR